MLQALVSWRPHDAVALITAEQTWSVGSVLNRAGDIARELSHQRWIQPKPRILVPSGHPALLFAAVIGCAEAGAIAVPWREERQPRRHLAELVGASAVLYDSADPAGRLELLGYHASESGDPWPGDLIVMTSGSSGQPKGVLLDLNRVVLNAALAGWSIDITDCDAWSIDIDLALMSAIGHLFMAWHAGIPLYCLGGFDRQSRIGIFRGRRVGFGGAPLQLVTLAETLPLGVAPAMLVSSGDFLDADALLRLWQRFPHTPIAKMYGLTEVSGRFCVAPDALLREQPNAAGRPMPGFTSWTMREAGHTGENDIGEIVVDSPLLFHGYCSSAAVFTPRVPGPFRTGDLGTQGADQVVTLAGRRDDTFKVGGEKVDRISIERMLRAPLSNAEFCVLPVPNPKLGHVPALFIGMRKDSALPMWAEVVSYLRDSAPSRYIPAIMVVVPDGLPRLDNGKIDKQQLIANWGGYPILP